MIASVSGGSLLRRLGDCELICSVAPIGRGWPESDKQIRGWILLLGSGRTAGW
jgi:hypothetical protein